jgi:hypothetical protein
VEVARWLAHCRGAAAIGIVVLRIIIGTAMDPTAHNLWPQIAIRWRKSICLRGCKHAGFKH